VSESAQPPRPHAPEDGFNLEPIKTDAIVKVADGSSEDLPPSRTPGDPHANGGAREQLDELMESHGDAIYSLCRRMLRDPDHAADVLQQVFLQAYRDLHSFDGRAAPHTWLYSIAVHRCKDALRAKWRRAQRIQDDAEAVDTFKDPAASPEAALQQQRQLVDLANCVGKLSDDARLAVLLRYQLGLSFEEMSMIVKANSDTLQARVRRALPLLKRCLERKGWTGEWQ